MGPTSSTYLVRAQLEFDWEFEDKGNRRELRRPHRLPVTFGPFKVDQSPNFEFHLLDLGWLEPDTKEGLHPDWEYPVSLLYVESRLEVPEGSHPQAWVDETLEQLEMLFRLFQPGNIHIRRHGFMWHLTETKPKLSLFFRYHPPKAEPAPLYDQGPYRLDDTALTKFVDFFNSYWGIVQRKPPLIYTALYRFSASYERRTLADRLTELVIALEALFGDDGADSVTYKIALRCASWIYSPGEARAKAFETIKRIYSDRSRIVHGRKLDSEYSNQEIQHLEDHLRQALIRFLEEHRKGNIISSGKQLDALLFFQGS